MRHAPIILALTALVAAVYWPVANYGFVNQDDGLYVYDNSVVLDGLTLSSVRTAATDLSTSLWTPLVLLSYQTEVEFFGPNPRVMHVTNVLLHALNAALLYLLTFQMTRRTWASAAVAALFAVHPMHVESVAWISERKDVLSTVFWLGSTMAYVAYTRTKARSRYATALALFVFGLLCKPMLVTLPFTLLLLDFWPLRRIDSPRELRGLAAEKIPFFAIAAAFTGLCLFAQSRAGAVQGLDYIPLAGRIENTLVSYASYLLKAFVPHGLAAYYPRPIAGYSASIVAASAALLALLTATALALARKAPFVPVGWLWFLGTLVPVIGLIQVGDQSMADRYTYIPYIGLSWLVVWAASETILKRRLETRRAAGLAFALATVALAIAAHAQVRVWRNSETLFQHALLVTENNVMAHVKLAEQYIEDKNPGRARDHLDAILAIHDTNRSAHTILGLIHVGQSEFDTAIEHFEIAAESQYKRDRTYQLLGAAHHALGHLTKAEEYYRRSIGEDSEGQKPMEEACIGFLQILISQGRNEEAQSILPQFLQWHPKSGGMHFEAANLAEAGGNVGEAETRYREAARLEPENIATWVNLGNLCGRQERFAEAIECYRNALQIDSSNQNAHRNLAVAYEASGHPDKARIHRDRAEDRGVNSDSP